MDTSSTIIENLPILMDRFQVIKTLGEGAAGAVYYVSDRRRDGARVALKVLVNDAAFDENTLVRFREEHKACRAIRHPNVVEAYELIELDGALAFTMEYVKGTDLSSVVEKQELDEQTIYSYIDQILCGLEALHEHGILHRDIKLENILVSEAGEIKITDLGLIKQHGREARTRSGILLGTAQYMAPEYIKMSQFDERSDIYAVGVVLYELLTGMRRLKNQGGNEAIRHLLVTNFSIPRETLKGISPKAVALIDAATHPDVRMRFQTTQEMRKALSDSGIFKRDSVLNIPVGSHSRRSIPSFLGVLLIGIIVVSAGVLTWSWSGKEEIKKSPLTLSEYQGTLQSGEQEVPISVRKTSKGLSFRSEHDRCLKGEVLQGTNTLRCEGSGGRLLLTTAEFWLNETGELQGVVRLPNEAGESEEFVVVPQKFER